MNFQRCAMLAALLILPQRAGADDSEAWQPLFNGKDLSGWRHVNTAPDTWQVRDGMIVCSGQPRGFLRTERKYENYILELEWRHVREGGNAGLMVHADPLPQVGAPYPESVEVQVMDGDHGSMFGIRGCTIRPLTNPRTTGGRPRAQAVENRAHPAGRWNHYRLLSQGGALELAVNGEVVTRAADATQVKGYICLESEASEVHFRNLRIRELPGSSPPPEKVAADDEGFTSLFDGLTFKGWKHHASLNGRWEASDGVVRLHADQPPRMRQQDDNLWTEKSYRNFILIADWRLTGKPVRKLMNDFTEDGLIKRDERGRPVTHEILHAGDSGVFLRGDRKAQVNIWSQPMGSGDINPYHKDAKLPPELRRACMPKIKADNLPRQWNRFVVSMHGDRVTVVLNGKTVIEQAQLPGVADSGPIGLQNHGDAIEFRNLFIRELP